MTYRVRCPVLVYGTVGVTIAFACFAFGWYVIHPLYRWLTS